MNGCIQAQCRSGVWHLTRQPAQQLSQEDESLVRQSLALGRAKAQEMYRTLGAPAGVWQLELSKAALDEGEVIMGLAAQLAQRCIAQPDAAHTVRAQTCYLSRRAVTSALQERGQRVAWGWIYPVLDRLQFAVATLLASAFWLGTVVRSTGKAEPLPESADMLIAAHGEWTTRTRHVLGLCLAGQPAPVVIVLGRPKSSLKAVQESWSRHLGCESLRLLRPFNLRSACQSLPRALALGLAGGRLMARQPCKPRFSEQVAMAYRCFLGAASARWWTQSGAQVKTVVYGHTGMADTTLLEQAQHAGGTETVHAVHGISAGLNFTGRSSRALFRCEHDARWHEKLGGYGRCKAHVSRRPEYVRGSAGILFLSNHLHPMNMWFRAFGPADELKALSIIAAAADQLGISRSQVVWKPHPIFATLDEPLRHRVAEAVKSFGFACWQDGVPLEKAADFRHVVCTRSTVALDMLQLGMVPIILDTQLNNAQDAVSIFPYQASDPASLVKAAHLSMRNSENDKIFDDLWAQIGVATAVSLSLVNKF